MTVGFERERCNILRCLADMAWAEDEAEVEKNYHAAEEELRRYYDKLVDKLAEKEKNQWQTKDNSLCKS